MASLFFSYSHTDEQLRDELGKHLSMLRREGTIESWHDRRIVPGQQLDHAIDRHLQAASIILLLVSSDFLASDYCYDVEVRRAMERHERGDATVIPVILRPCDWRAAPFGRLLALPRDGKPVTLWPNQDEAFLSVVAGIRVAVAARRVPPAVPDPNQARPATARGAGSDRSRPDRFLVPRTFSELEKDNFLEQAFNTISESFQTFLGELEHAHAGLQTRFRRLDAARLTAVVYRAGHPVSRCTIWMGTRSTLMRGIGYVENDSGETNTLNESLSVEADAHSLYLKPMGMAFVGQDHPPQTLSAETAAEFLWTLFLRRLRDRA